MASVPYFAYGSNMLIAWLRARCPSARARQVAWADKYALAFCKKSRDGSGKATISAATDGRVFGVVFDLDETELPALDKAEGAGKGYDRIDDFQVHIAGCREPLRAVTYIANVASIDPDLKSYDWYLKLIVAGARQHELPPRYIEAIEAMPSIADPKPDRKSRLEALKLLGKTPKKLLRDTCIAGKTTVADWTVMKGRLDGCNGPETWNGELATESSLQEAFIRKFDSLCAE